MVCIGISFPAEKAQTPKRLVNAPRENCFGAVNHLHCNPAQEHGAKRTQHLRMNHARLLHCKKSRSLHDNQMREMHRYMLATLRVHGRWQEHCCLAFAGTVARAYWPAHSSSCAPAHRPHRPCAPSIPLKARGPPRPTPRTRQAAEDRRHNCPAQKCVSKVGAVRSQHDSSMGCGRC